LRTSDRCASASIDQPGRFFWRILSSFSFDLFSSAIGLDDAGGGSALAAAFSVEAVAFADFASPFSAFGSAFAATALPVDSVRKTAPSNAGRERKRVMASFNSSGRPREETYAGRRRARGCDLLDRVLPWSDDG
jgi:hypothetical protein